MSIVSSTAWAAPVDATKQLVAAAGYDVHVCQLLGVGDLGDYCARLNTSGLQMQKNFDAAAKKMGFRRVGGWTQDEGTRSAIFVKGSKKIRVDSLDLRAYGYADAYIASSDVQP